ncbi:unannotated protein [freshwater metagenome]|uniref:Unannotated protein n=1 Tax=freshwater metagenome TaxID=449393 RepID=A0A6J7IRZ6_9ZZZZ
MKVLVPVPEVAVTVSKPATPTFKFKVALVAVKEMGLATFIVFEVVSERVVESPRVLVELTGVAVASLYWRSRATACTSALLTVSAAAELVTLTSSIARKAPCAQPPVASHVPLIKTYL